MEGSWIEGYGDRVSKTEILLTPGAADAARKLLAKQDDATEVEARLARLGLLVRGFEHPYGLELLSNVHWAVQEAPEATENVDVVIATLQRWNPRKEHLFRPKHICKAWERLRSQGWFASQAVTV